MEQNLNCFFFMYEILEEHPILDKVEDLEFLDMRIDLLKTHKELQDRSFITPQLLVNPQIKPIKTKWMVKYWLNSLGFSRKNC